MTKEEMAALKPLDLIRHKSCADALIVHANYGSLGVAAARVQLVSNPIEWDRVGPDGAVISTR